MSRKLHAIGELDCRSPYQISTASKRQKRADNETISCISKDCKGVEGRIIFIRLKNDATPTEKGGGDHTRRLRKADLRHGRKVGPHSTVSQVTKYLIELSTIPKMETSSNLTLKATNNAAFEIQPASTSLSRPFYTDERWCEACGGHLYLMIRSFGFAFRSVAKQETSLACGGFTRPEGTIFFFQSSGKGWIVMRIAKYRSEESISIHLPGHVGSVWQTLSHHLNWTLLKSSRHLDNL